MRNVAPRIVKDLIVPRFDWPLSRYLREARDGRIYEQGKVFPRNLNRIKI